MVAAGASRVLAMTLHSPQAHGFFSVPVDHLHALRELAGHFRALDLSHTTVVSPDLGNAKEAAAFARRLGVPVAAGAKQRFCTDTVPVPSSSEKLTALSIAPALAQAVQRIHDGESVSALFDVVLVPGRWPPVTTTAAAIPRGRRLPDEVVARFRTADYWS
jgi:phosphoribosylpyrophosphate synthetase